MAPSLELAIAILIPLGTSFLIGSVLKPGRYTPLLPFAPSPLAPPLHAHSLVPGCPWPLSSPEGRVLKFLGRQGGLGRQGCFALALGSLDGQVNGQLE